MGGGVLNEFSKLNQSEAIIRIQNIFENIQNSYYLIRDGTDSQIMEEIDQKDNNNSRKYLIHIFR